MTPKKHSRIVSTGAAFPGTVLTSQELEERLGLPNNWILKRTGILERRILAEGENNSDFGAKAATIALQRSGIAISELDLIIACTNSPDRWMPSLGATVQAKIAPPGLHIPAFDLVSACAGWIAGLQVADSLVRTGYYKNILLLGSEAMSRALNWKDVDTSIVFADGAGAALISGVDSGNEGGTVLDLLLRSEGQEGDILQVPANGSRLTLTPEVLEKNLHFVHMKGDRVFYFAVKYMVECALEILKKNGFTIADVDWLIPHQANLMIIKFVGEELGIDPKKVATNVERKGNTSAASIPTCLDQMVEEGKLQRGNLVLMVAFGGGLTWGSALVRW